MKLKKPELSEHELTCLLFAVEGFRNNLALELNDVGSDSLVGLLAIERLATTDNLMKKLEAISRWGEIEEEEKQQNPRRRHRD